MFLRETEAASAGQAHYTNSFPEFQPDFPNVFRFDKFRKSPIVSHKGGGARPGRFHRFAIRTAVSRAISIIWVRELCRSAGGSSSLVTRLSVTEQMVRARFPASAALM